VPSAAALGTAASGRVALLIFDKRHRKPTVRVRSPDLPVREAVSTAPAG
jgi:hypothetical protein